MLWGPFLMKKWLKSEICGSREQCTRPTDVHCTLHKSQQLRLNKKKRENAQTENANMNKLNPNRAYI